ncbi:MAG: PEP-CTERM sorting domain-containing protein [Pirellulales bacterium]|nr:PEP-CTERM sorting domain-containing protein [Pirellulales bacterium]
MGFAFTGDAARGSRQRFIQNLRQGPQTLMLTTTNVGSVTRQCLLALVINTLCLGLYSPATAGPYSLTKIAASTPGSTFEESFAPAISNNGMIAYLGNPASGIVQEGVYRYQGGSGNLVAPASATGGIYGYGGLSVNDSGTIAFQDFNAIYSVTGTTITTVAAPGIPSGIGVTLPSIASDGSVAFALRNAFDSVTVRTVSSGVPQDIAFNATLPVVQQYAAFNSPGQTPAMSNSGNVAYLWIGADGTTPQLNLYHGGTTSVIAGLAPLGQMFFNTNDTHVAFYSTPAGGSLGLFVGDGSSISPVPLPSGLLPVGPLSFNNPGTIAFMGNISGSNLGIYTADSSTPLIKLSDPLDGSTINGINFGPHGLNDNGQIVFSAVLANGNSGVYLLSPVPEPSTSALFAAGLALLAAGALRRRCRPKVVTSVPQGQRACHEGTHHSASADPRACAPADLLTWQVPPFDSLLDGLHRLVATFVKPPDNYIYDSSTESLPAR